MGLEEDAKKAYDNLRTGDSCFPNKFCKIAAIFMSFLGYGIIQGQVLLDNYCGSGKRLEMVHYWNYDIASGKEFDLTSEQFNIHIRGTPLPEVGIWHPESRPGFYQERRRNLNPYELF